MWSSGWEPGLLRRLKELRPVGSNIGNTGSGTGTNTNPFIVGELGLQGTMGTLLSSQVFYKSKLVLKFKVLLKKKKSEDQSGSVGGM